MDEGASAMAAAIRSPVVRAPCLRKGENPLETWVIAKKGRKRSVGRKKEKTRMRWQVKKQRGSAGKIRGMVGSG
jgi:hypothetical protein